MSLLKFPELLSWYMERFFPIGKVAVRLLAPVSKKAFKVELPNKAAMNDIERLYLKLIQLQELLKNREITSIRIVTMPEKMVVEETKISYMYMNLYNFNVDGLYINRILPKDISNSFFDKWVLLQEKYITQLEEGFCGIPIYKIPWYEEELRGRHTLERICEDVLKDHAVFEQKIITLRESFIQNDKGYLLSVTLPHTKKEDLDVYQSQTDVIIKLGNFKRNIALPNVLCTYDITSAKLENQKLEIQFEKNEER